MPVGFITDGFVSAFNPNKPTLVINNIDTGVAVDGYSIVPNDSYIIQETGFGTIKTVWSHLSLTGDVTLQVNGIPESVANFIDKICTKQDTNYYVGFLGYLYRTEQVDVTIQPSPNTVALLDLQLTFYGKLPYSAPIFRPGFSTLYSNEISRFTDVNPSEYMLVPLPGNSAKNREDTMLTILKSGSTSRVKVLSSVKDYTDTSISYSGVLTSNFESNSRAVISIMNPGDGVDDLVMASLSGNTVSIQFLQVKNNILNMNYRSKVTINEVGASRVGIRDGYLFVYVDAKGSYKLIRYALQDKNVAATRKVIEDSTQIRTLDIIPAEGGIAPLAPPTNSNSFNLVLDDNKTKLLMPANSSDVSNAYDSYVLPLNSLYAIGGADTSNVGILAARQIEDGRLIVFFKNFKAGNGYVHFAIINFRDRNNERGVWTNPFVVDYRVTSYNLTSLDQVFTYLGISQTNTAVLSDKTCYMSTEAYTDFYVESNVLALTQSSLGFNFFLYQDGNDVVVKCMTK